MEISRQWKILPTDVYQIKLERPKDFLFMRAMVRAEYEWSVGDYDIKPPADVPNFDILYDRL